MNNEDLFTIEEFLCTLFSVLIVFKIPHSIFKWTSAQYVLKLISTATGFNFFISMSNKQTCGLCDGK